MHALVLNDRGDEQDSVCTLIPPRRLVIWLANSLADIGESGPELAVVEAIESFLVDSVSCCMLLLGNRGYSSTRL